jgi:uncharacterized protein YkwD/chitodextrinase
MTRSRPLAVLAAAAAAITVSLLPGGAAAVVGDCVPQASWGTLNGSYAQQVFQLVNQHRAARGLSQLGALASLSAAADWKSLHMAGYGYMAHNDPAPPVNRSVSDRLLACGYPATSSGWGENIAYGYTSPAAVMSAWLNSPGHRSNIENATYRSLGVGVARAASGALYWTQEFGTAAGSGGPAPPAPPPPPPPTPPPPPPAPPPADMQPPSTPTGFVVSARTQTSVTLRWNAATDNRGVTGYGIYVGSSRVGTVGGTSATVMSLGCNRMYTFSVDAVDLAQNRSGKATLTTMTSPCSTSPPPPPPPPAPAPSPPAPPPPAPGGTDTKPPIAPTGLQFTATASTLTIRWNASTDNVGVAGYRVWRGSTLARITTATSTTLSRLPCGTLYWISVQAYDARNNASSRAGAYARTSSCQ